MVCCINKVLNKIGSVVMVDMLFLLLKEFCGVVDFIMVLDGLEKCLVGLIKNFRFWVVCCFLIVFFMVFIFLVFKDRVVK